MAASRRTSTRSSSSKKSILPIPKISTPKIDFSMKTNQQKFLFFSAFTVIAYGFAALFARPSEIGSSAIALRELGRIDAELSAAADRPSRQLLEVSMLKARASGPWAKLGRGGARTLQPSRLSELLEGVLELRARRY